MTANDPSSMTVSAIIPTFNRADLLGETIRAVLAQTRAPDEVLIIDDGSDDHTTSIVETFGMQVKLISKANSGKADSLNQALAASSGSHIWIVDDDDIPLADGLEMLTTLLAANKGAQIAYGRHIRFSQTSPGAPKTYQETGYWDTRGPDHFLIATLEDFFVHQPAMLVSRALYERAGLFNTQMIASEDYEMLIRLGLHGTAVATDDIIFEQRVHSGIRGQKGHQFSASDRNAKWIAYDQKIFTAVYDELPLEAFLPRGFTDPDNAPAQRQALIQRASIMARKKLWPLAIKDLETISNSPFRRPLDDTERAILRRALLSKYGCSEVFDMPEIVADLRALSASSRLGRALVASIGRSLLWHFRTDLANGKIGRAFHAIRTYFMLR
jgi:GT2 family glycosyltransferase